MCDADLWTEVTPLLAPGWNVVHGDLFHDDTIPAMAARVLAAAPERFVAVGFSMGGFAAREMALRAPGRVGGLALDGRQSGVSGKRGSVRVAFGGVRRLKK